MAARVVPKPSERRETCATAREEERPAVSRADATEPKVAGAPAKVAHPSAKRGSADDRQPAAATTTLPAAPRPGAPPARPGDVIRLAPNILSLHHWDRSLGGLLYAASPRVDWASLLRRPFSVDVLECPKCHGRLRVVAVITEPEPVRRILAHLGIPTEAPPLPRARDPADELDDDEVVGQLSLDFL